MDNECVEGIVIDVCAKSFMLTSDEGSSRTVTCDTTEEFMNVMKVVTDQADPEIIQYADLNVYGKTKN
jgi:hypothetical protein